MREKEVDLSKVKRIGNRYNWHDSIGADIYYQIAGNKYKFKLVGYDKKKQRVTLKFNGENYPISTVSLSRGGFSNIIEELKYKDFYYEENQIISTIKKDCLIIDRFIGKDHKKIYTCECLDCGSKKEVTEICLRYKGFTCDYCSDKISYPEKVVFILLKLLGVKYKYQKRFDWSKKVCFPCDKKPTDKIYDFYIPSLETIIEVNGELHYQESKWSNSRPLSYIKDNDKYKKELAIKNGIIKYITLNCLVSDFEYIKESVIESELNEILDLSSVNWNEINTLTYSSLMKTCSNLWNDGVKSTKQIAETLGLSKQTVITYLKKMSSVGICDYDPKLELKNGAKYTQQKRKKEIICLDNGLIFDSAIDCSRDSANVFGESLCQSKINLVCLNKRNHHKGYHFKYTENLTDEEKIRYGLNKAI